MIYEDKKKGVSGNLTRSEEQQIISAVLSGDRNAYEELVTANQKNVYNLALNLTQNKHDAMDISQDAFVKAYTNLRDFRGDSSFSVWLYKLTYNICIDFLRKKQRRPSSSLFYENEYGDLNEIEIADMRHLPEDELELKELREAASKAIDLLSHEQRQILIMREYTGMSYRSIADTLYINEGTVKSRISRARKNLARILVAGGTFSAFERQKDGKEDAENE